MLLSLFLAMIFRLHSSAATLTQYVNPLFSTRGGSGFGGWGSQNRNPGAMHPHPLLRLGPDTTRFDAVLGEDSTQHQVYEAAPRRLVIDFINGKNASLFAYGQTGTYADVC